MSATSSWGFHRPKSFVDAGVGALGFFTRLDDDLVVLLILGAGFWATIFFFTGGGGTGKWGLDSAFTTGSNGFAAAAGFPSFSATGWGGWGMAVEVCGTGDAAGVVVVVVGAFRRPRSDFTKLLSTISSSNFLRLIEREELRLGVTVFLGSSWGACRLDLGVSNGGGGADKAAATVGVS